MQIEAINGPLIVARSILIHKKQTANTTQTVLYIYVHTQSSEEAKEAQYRNTALNSDLHSHPLWVIYAGLLHTWTTEAASERSRFTMAALSLHSFTKHNTPPPPLPCFKDE